MKKDEEWDVDPTEDSPEDEAEPTLKYEIMNFPADRTLDGYLELWGRGELKVPPFQRAYIWDQVKASKLIESFLLGLPVPGVFLFKEKGSPNYLIIDGQQRITSIINFLKGVFNDKVFKLKNVDPKWDGKRFTDLTEDEQFRLKGVVLRSTIIQQINPKDKSSIYHIFERLNTGGVNLNPMEIRQCVSYGEFVEALKKLNKNKDWRKIIGRETEDRRLRDVELILRCLALHNKLESYEKPMKGFLNDFMEIERESPSDYEDLEKKFAEASKHIFDALGEKPFHLRGRLNYGVLDSIYIAVFKLGEIENFKEKFENLKSDEEYFKAVTINTSDNLEVKIRINLALEYLG